MAGNELLDSVAEASVHGLLQDLRRAGKTIVIISHRLGICYADKIVVLDGGRIVAEGGHTDLLAESACTRLWQTQAGSS
ncbi:hypothetical protein EAS62_31705 [Bradyrhizobium zhanjiangense]|uniref:ABC transporter ATP-binding protein n=1 Tax=Bradyrhizobium zhanjiangense TaxID=1325107 RepID=A0ABY0DC86_9BRAD|nr:hypothetical protein EAS62_31705 [Bradyrhizobium zhanjiangense]